MTKKDYIKLAQALKDCKPIGERGVSLVDTAYIQSWENVVNHVALTLKHDNQRFNRNRFLAACGYNE